MTRRERKERRLELRQEWAAKREAKSASAFDAARRSVEGIPFGQPILVGHHSERHHRAALGRHDNAMRRGCESADMAKHHHSTAGGISDQLDRSIFSDDDNATEALRERIAGLEAERARCKAINAAWKKAGKPSATVTLDETPEALVERWRAVQEACSLSPKALAAILRNMQAQPYHPQPFPAYVGQNLSKRIGTDRKRIEQIETEAKEQAACEAAGGVLVKYFGTPAEYALVRFAEHPGSEVVQAMRDANYSWGGGHWSGPWSRLPPVVLELETEAKLRQAEAGSDA